MTTKKPIKKDVRRRVWIKSQLELCGSSFADIARALKVSRQSVRSALDKPYPKMEAAIAKQLNRTPAEIWPERYAA
jgi:Ner family transcriptional regulator